MFIIEFVLFQMLFRATLFTPVYSLYAKLG